MARATVSFVSKEILSSSDGIRHDEVKRIEGTQTAGGLEVRKPRNRDLEKLNESLVEELDNVRSHLRQSGAGIRLSRSELRPLTADQVQDMKVRASVSRGGQ